MVEQLRQRVQELFFANGAGGRRRDTCDIVVSAGKRGGIYASGRRRAVGRFSYLNEPMHRGGEIQIQPTHQGHGIGTRLLLDTIARAHVRRKKVSLSTALKNQRAFELYRRLGFRHIAQTDTHNHMECEPES